MDRLENDSFDPKRKEKKKEYDNIKATSSPAIEVGTPTKVTATRT